ncbi:MAG: hypothetical protein AB2693_26970 [Candidatus Thiodiazotropha sp.]
MSQETPKSKQFDSDFNTRKRKEQEGSPGEKSFEERSPELKISKSASATELTSLMDPDYLSEGQESRIAVIITKTFQKPDFIEKISPGLMSAFQPLMRSAINEAVTNAVSRVEKNVIAPLKKKNKDLNQKLEVVESEMKSKDTLIKKQESEIKELRDQLLAQDQKLDELEQYGRRSSIRLFNLPPESVTNCEDAVVKLCNETLKVNISSEDIERCHPLGAKQVICKFRSYKTKAEVYGAKKYLKGNPRKIFLTEDLTRRNHRTVEELLRLRKSGRIHSFWTIDGKIYFKSAEGVRPQRETSVPEIESKLSEEPIQVTTQAMAMDHDQQTY